MTPSTKQSSQELKHTENTDHLVTTYPLHISPNNPKMQVLLLGGHGKIALHLTPLLLNRAWNVTSVVRNPDHENEILALGKGRKGKLNVLISSLENVKSATDAQKILETVTPDYVVWSAGTCPSPLPLPLNSKHLNTHPCNIHISRRMSIPTNKTPQFQVPVAKVAQPQQSPSTKKPPNTS